jgi:hypothetical protein
MYTHFSTIPAGAVLLTVAASLALEAHIVIVVLPNGHRVRSIDPQASDREVTFGDDGPRCPLAIPRSTISVNETKPGAVSRLAAAPAVGAIPCSKRT